MRLTLCHDLYRPMKIARDDERVMIYQIFMTKGRSHLSHNGVFSDLPHRDI